MLTGKSSTLTTALDTLNPFRCKGYVYDEQTGLYYLRSRYYNPEWGRFINADALLGNIRGLLNHNVYAYCGNNPVKRISRDEFTQSYTYVAWPVGLGSSRTPLKNVIMIPQATIVTPIFNNKPDKAL